MAKLTKAQKEQGHLYDPAELFDDRAGVQLVKKLSRAKFDESIDVAVRLGVDVRHSDQVVRGAVVLPNGTGKNPRVAVFAKGDKAKEAQEAGADIVGAEELVEKVQGGWLQFDTAVATPDMMALVGRLGKLLGPRGLMPNPRTGTVTFDVASAVREIKAGKVEYRTEKAGIVHATIGRISFADDALVENLSVLLDALVKAKPQASKGQYIKTVTLSSTMGPGVKLNPLTVGKALATTA